MAIRRLKEINTLYPKSIRPLVAYWHCSVLDCVDRQLVKQVLGGWEAGLAFVSGELCPSTNEYVDQSEGKEDGRRNRMIMIEAGDSLCKNTSMTSFL